MKTYHCFNHQGKADTLIKTLDMKYQHVEKGKARIGFILTDNDVAGRMAQLERMRARGTKVFFVYPHSGRVNLYADFYETWRYTTAQFISAEGHFEIMRQYGYAKPLYIIGWHLCPILPFKPTAGRRVLFAPIHPRMAEMDRDANRAAFHRLAALQNKGEIELTVRFIPPFEQNAIPRMDGITYVKGTFTPDTAMIDRADVVIAHQTYGHLAVARGKPLIGLGENMPPHTVREKNMRTAKHWNEYKRLVRYPFDILDSDDLGGLIKQVCASDDDILDWRSRMIGSPFDPERFLEIIRDYTGT